MSFVELSHGVPGQNESSTRVGAPGGDIGRASGNAVVLADTTKAVSRVHARIVFRARGARVIALGHSGITVDGEWLEPGEEAPIPAGTRIEIGPYLLQVTRNAQV
jgi:FHA domain-containing protein